MVRLILCLIMFCSFAEDRMKCWWWQRGVQLWMSPKGTCWGRLGWKLSCSQIVLFIVWLLSKNRCSCLCEKVVVVVIRPSSDRQWVPLWAAWMNSTDVNIFESDTSDLKSRCTVEKMCGWLTGASSVCILACTWTGLAYYLPFNSTSANIF